MANRTRSMLDREFGQIRDDLLRVTGLVDSAIASAMRCLQAQDVALAQQVIQEDSVINDLRFRVEEECLTLIATQQPMAGDLRTAMAAVSIVTDLERIADHATGIAKTVIRVSQHKHQVFPAEPLQALDRMSVRVRAMLRAALDTYIARDAQAARQVAATDDEIDHMYKILFDDLLRIMAADTAAIAPGTYLLWCGHNLERCGDRITNIAERVIFMSTGELGELNF
jgi:phosphate transport system protein